MIKLKVKEPPEGNGFFQIVDDKTGGLDFFEAVMYPERAKRIVKCWNSHDALLEALKKAVSIIEVLFEEKGDPPPSCMMDFCEMTAAIAQAEK